jgi:hypothetical protein
MLVSCLVVAGRQVGRRSSLTALGGLLGCDDVSWCVWS